MTTGQCYLLELCVPDVVVNEKNTRDNAEHFVQQVNLGDSVLSLPCMFDQESNEADIRV